MIVASDEKRAKENNYKCPFRAKACDGLCNNCPQDIVHSKNPTFTQAGGRSQNDENDYEGAILAQNEAVG